ncbi:glyoxalase [Sphingomonas sp.]|uniref:glyoxalase n=1 Tax=Sphingomonas sp. TaxID=28214 RepID=UPI003B3B1CF5
MKAIVGLVAGVIAMLPGSASARDFAVSPQYDSTHVYVAPADINAFLTSFTATFGGSVTKPNLVQVTPTPSKTISQLAQTPVGTLSVFAFQTPIPFPFGSERTGYLVTDLDAAVAAAKAAGATVLVEPFPDPIGRDALIQWPGGVGMQLYWHTVAPHYPALATIPENRIYLTKGAADAFLRAWLRFSHGHILSDHSVISGAAFGRSESQVRLVRIQSRYGEMVVVAGDGAWPWPYGREISGYGVTDLAATLEKANAAGAVTLISAHDVDGRQEAMLQFPGGYIAAVHGPAGR